VATQYNLCRPHATCAKHPQLRDELGTATITTQLGAFIRSDAARTKTRSECAQEPVEGHSAALPQAQRASRCSGHLGVSPDVNRQGRKRRNPQNRTYPCQRDDIHEGGQPDQRGSS
jgi:hypothetical protein